MLDAQSDSMADARVRTLQIIVAALAMGVMLFLALVLFLGLGKEPPVEERQPIITYIALAYGLAAFVAGPLLSTVIATSSRRKLAAGQARPDAPAPTTGRPEPAAGRGLTQGLTGIFVVKTIIAAAIYEGAALFLCVAYMLDGNRLSAILAALLAAGILMQVPTRDRAQRWLDEQRRLAEQDPVSSV